jgi:hypothetical protein
MNFPRIPTNLVEQGTQLHFKRGRELLRRPYAKAGDSVLNPPNLALTQSFNVGLTEAVLFPEPPERSTGMILSIPRDRDVSQVHRGRIAT